MATKRGGSGWKWFYLVTKVFVVLWVLALIPVVVNHSAVKVPLINLVVWSLLCFWASRRVNAA